ncbi:MAG: carbohydrate kinase, partial [Candidatus Brocadiae bacterium]|nr:carbohydrate kinase [Candidatus Brocadiia bacterium]
MLLGLDLGTTNVKAVLAEADGRVISRASVPVRMLHVGADGLEQDIGEIRSAALQALREATGRTDASAVAAVGVSSQGGALQMMDAEGRPLGRVISWM